MRWSGLIRLPALLVTLVVVLSLSACASTPGSSLLTEKDAGKTVEIARGEILEVVLRGNPTTGYLWEMVSGDPTILRPIGKPEFKPERAAVGAGGVLTLRFEAASAGRTGLELAYRRPWEKDVPPIETFEVTVVVK
jgi:inhibitor of cysteine peptidase